MIPLRKPTFFLFVAFVIVALSATAAPAQPQHAQSLEQAAVTAPPLHPAGAPPLAPAAVNNAFESLNPARLADTRPGSTTFDGLYAGTGAVGTGETFELLVVGRGGVPSLAVGAVAINVTAVAPTGNGFLTVWPTDAGKPNASNLNFVAGDVVPNLVVVRVGSGGRISIFNESGNTHLIVDVVGWFADNAGLQPLVPARLLDTRPGAATIDGVAAGAGALGGNSAMALDVVARGGVPATGVATVVLNVTVTAPSAGGFITAWPSGTTRPNSSNLNFIPGQTVASLVIAKVGANGRVDLYNSAGETHLIVDVMGWFGSDSELQSLQPARLLDTRPGAATIDGSFAGVGVIGENTARSVVVLGRGGVPATGVDAVVLSVTVTAPTMASFLTVWPAGFQRPNASSLNYTPGKTVANMVIAQVGVSGLVALYNASGSTHVIVDVVGWLPPNVPLSLDEPNLVPGMVGQAYNRTVPLSGSQGPYQVAASGVAPGLNLASTGTFSGTPTTPGTSSMQLLASDRFGRAGAATLPHSIFPASSAFTTVTPTSVMNTFVEPLSIGANTTRSFSVGGIAGVPSSNVAAVLSVGAFGWGTGFATLYPAGNVRPITSNLVFDQFEFASDIVVVPIGVSGQVSFYTSELADARIDVVGYIPLGGSFTPITPVRVTDTRLDPLGAIGAGAPRDVTIAGTGPVPSGATDVLAIVATINSAAVAGAFSIWDTGGPVPAAPAIRWTAQTTVSVQFVVVHLSADGRVTIGNSSSAATHFILDLYGYFT